MVTADMIPAWTASVPLCGESNVVSGLAEDTDSPPLSEWIPLLRLKKPAEYMEIRTDMRLEHS
mgnify:CR=1 FL=1